MLSLHAVPAGRTGLLHCPVLSLQTPGSWHRSEAVQVTLVTPLQMPFVHQSCDVHRLVSLHVVPFGLSGAVQAPSASQVPAM